MKRFGTLIGAALLLGAVPVFAQDQAAFSVVSEFELKGNQQARSYDVVISEQITSKAASGASTNIALGETAKLPFCAVAETTIYRHGEPRHGELSCLVYVDQGVWRLHANGPTYDAGEGGYGEVSCSAVCFRAR